MQLLEDIASALVFVVAVAGAIYFGRAARGARTDRSQ